MARLGEPGCAEATSLVACFTSTGELHERLYAPYELDTLGYQPAPYKRDPCCANANAYAERWIRTVRTECLDWLLIVGRGHLEQVL